MREAWPARFVLDSLNTTQVRAVFKKDPTSEVGSGLVFRRLHEKMLIGAPLVAIQTRAIVNDSGLPDLEINDKEKRITFDWKQMFTQLLGEEHVFNVISRQGLGWDLDPEGASRNIHEAHRKIARK